MFGSLILAAVAVVVAIVVGLCAAGVVHRNPVAGLRLPAFFESEGAWRIGHRAALLPTIVGAAVCIVFAVVSALVPRIGERTSTVVAAAILVVGVIAGAVLGSRAIRRS